MLGTGGDRRATARSAVVASEASVHARSAIRRTRSAPCGRCSPPTSARSAGLLTRRRAGRSTSSAPGSPLGPFSSMITCAWFPGSGTSCTITAIFDPTSQAQQPRHRRIRHMPAMQALGVNATRAAADRRRAPLCSRLDVTGPGPATDDDLTSGFATGGAASRMSTWWPCRPATSNNRFVALPLRVRRERLYPRYRQRPHGGDQLRHGMLGSPSARDRVPGCHGRALVNGLFAEGNGSDTNNAWQLRARCASQALVENNRGLSTYAISRARSAQSAGLVHPVYRPAA